MREIEHFQKVIQEFSPMLDSWWPYIFGFILGMFCALRNYIAGPTCPDNERIDGKTVVITGATSPRGCEIALELARRGGHIILAVKNYESGEKIAKLINQIPDASADVKLLDLSSLKNIREFADKLEVNEIDILINSAQHYHHQYQKTEDEFELNYVNNYLGHFLLIHLLLPKLKAAKQGRIINVTSEPSSRDAMNFVNFNFDINEYDSLKAWDQCKLALILMTWHMRFLLKDTNITINAVNDDRYINSKFLQHPKMRFELILVVMIAPFFWLIRKTPFQAAQTIIYAAVSDKLNKKSGEFFSDCQIKKLEICVLDEIVAEKLYNESLIHIRPFIECNSIESKNEVNN